MKTPLTYTKVHNHILAKLFKKPVVTNISRHCPYQVGRALIYHKTDSLIPGYRHDYIHTNNWEIPEQIRILNTLGYSVDVVDRSAPSSFTPRDKYDIFLGIGLDGSGHAYPRLAQSLAKAIKILYAVTSNPDTRNASLEQRYRQFTMRRQATLPPVRYIEDIDVEATMAATDYIFCVGNQVTSSTLSAYNKEIIRIYLSTAPNLSLDNRALYDKQADHFLYFAGDGNILKGLDLLVEAFARMPDRHLFVCTTLEPAFVRHYRRLLEKSPNIHIENFISSGSSRFAELTSLCAFTILPSCSEGSATSITTCMRRGLIPLVTPQTGIDVDKFGFLISDLSIPGLMKQIQSTAAMPPAQLRQQIIATYLASFQFTQQSFTKSFTEAISRVLVNENKPSLPDSQQPSVNARAAVSS